VGAQTFNTDVITTIAAALESLKNITDPQAIVMNPADAWALRLLQDANGQYISGGPFTTGATPQLWSVPIVKSRRVATGTALVGDFSSVNFLQREPLSVLAFNQHKDYAQRNIVYVRAELRAMQLIYNPRNIIIATLTGV
jgi:HK97 family phage major capsid protein